ncbi:MAG: hypothetical protein V3S69_06865 [Dehalococcoidales bacterium]
MAEANLVERIVKGPKPVHGRDPKTGKRTTYNVGDTIMLSPRSALNKARYLEIPAVAEAQAKVAKAEADAKAEAEKAEKAEADKVDEAEEAKLPFPGAQVKTEDDSDES